MVPEILSNTIPDKIRREHWAICKKCEIRIGYAIAFDLHFDWLDCPYVCDNDYEHWKEAQWKRPVDPASTS